MAKRRHHGFAGSVDSRPRYRARPDIDFVAVNDSSIGMNASCSRTNRRKGRIRVSQGGPAIECIDDGDQDPAEKDTAALPGRSGSRHSSPSTGLFPTREGKGETRCRRPQGDHQRAGQGEDITIVLGVTEDRYEPDAINIIATPAQTMAWPAAKASTTS